MTNNTQFLRTDKAIQASMLSLLRKKPFEKITVQDILDETPVSRATFYKHYHDKYEIVEKLQEEFVKLQADVAAALACAPTSQTQAMILSFIQHYGDTMQLLLKVQTERVNLPFTLLQATEEHYVKNSESPSKNLEANVYAAAMTAFQIKFLTADHASVDPKRVFLNVMLKLTGLEDDPETVKFLNQKLD